MPTTFRAPAAAAAICAPFPNAEEAREALEPSRERETSEMEGVMKDGEAGTPGMPVPAPDGADSRTMVWRWLVICSVAVAILDKDG